MTEQDAAPVTTLEALFIEDSVIDVELAVLELKRAGFGVAWSRIDTEAALREVLATKVPHIVLSDYSMPMFDGRAALRVVRELSPDLPFIFISGTIGEEQAIESIRHGATDYILKGNIRRLPTAVRRALSDAAERAGARATKEAHARLAAILEATSDFVAMCDADGRLIYMNIAARALTGADNPGPADFTLGALHPAAARDLLEHETIPHAIDKGIWQGETVLLAADGTEIPVSQVIIAHRGADRNLQYFSMIARDMRERKAYEERILYLANFDAVTELPNLSLLGDRVAQATAYGRRKERLLSMLAVDIDRFKLIVDGYGRAAGDLLLRQVGERIRHIIRDGDTVARMGADGFAILAADLAHPVDVVDVVRKLQRGLRAPFDIDAREVHITVSIGASVYPRDGGDFDTLLRNASAAMHRVKLEGQDGFQYYAAEMTRDAIERVELESGLRKALGRHELELHYQPQLDLPSGRIIAVEALMRWQHPERGWVSPGIFIPIAEHSDLIYELGDWALSTACHQLQSWGAAAAGLRVAVNVSARQFRGGGFTDAVARVLRETRLAPDRLELEMTEGVLAEDRDMTVGILDRLKALGARIAIDDFGTGYSNLSYLSRLPVDCLKIDQSFVQRCSTDTQDAAIVQAVISLARSLHMRVLAEGIETAGQLEFLRDHDCMEGQGYLFSRPLPAGALENFIVESSPRIDPGVRIACK